MSVDREYRTRITGNRVSNLGQSAIGSKDMAAPNEGSIDLGGSAESSDSSSGIEDHLTDVPDAFVNLKASERLTPPMSIAAASPTDNAGVQSFTERATPPENATALLEEHLSAPKFDSVMPEMSQERTPPNPTGHSMVEVHALAELLNQTKQLYQALPAQRRVAAGQDAFELLSLIRQLRESFSEYVQAHVTKQELKGELTSLRLLIESKK